MSGTDAGNEAEAVETPVPRDDEGEEAPDFDPGTWAPAENRFGMNRLLELREAMMPIEKPEAVKFLKFLFFPGYGLQEGSEDEKERKPDRDRGDRRENKKGKGKGKQQQGGRSVPGMGKTELQPGFVKGQWWRNEASNEMAVIVREGFSLMSQEVWKVPHGHYVQQAGPAEVFVSGQAAGLVRMPVCPSGWVTSDASSVGGPKYLEAARVARWKVSFKSDTPKGDILVRESVSLESDEVGCIRYGSFVTQCGPQATLEDGIIRMPITWADAQPSSSSGGVRTMHTGWVTCDASSQDGPKFFIAAPEELEPPKPAASEDLHDRGSPADKRGEDRRKANDGFASWDKNRTWKITNLEPSADKSLLMVTRAEPYAPGTGRVPPEDIVVRWLQNGEVVEQIGHSKKTRGYMVMPIRLLHDAQGGDVKEVEEGWVTRRLVEKGSKDIDGAWLVEIHAGEDENERERRREERRANRNKQAESSQG